MLRNHSLQMNIRDEVLAISDVKSEKDWTTKIYDVADLLPEEPVNPAMFAGEPYDILEAIQNTIPGPWLDVDGEGGTLSVLTLKDRQCLVVRGSWRMHEDITSLLQDIRSLPGEKKSTPKNTRPKTKE